MQIKNFIVSSLLVFALVVPALSQEGGSSGGDRHQVSLMLGKGMFYNNVGTYLLLPRNASSVGGSLQGGGVQNFISLSDPNNNSLLNMMGVEYQFLLNSDIAITFSGAGFISNTPWREAVDPTVDPINGNTTLPSYSNIDAQLMNRFVVNVGGIYKFNFLSNDRVVPYAGVQLTGQFASLSARSTYSGIDNLDEDRRDMGMRHGQVMGWSPSITGGIEYNLMQGMYIAMEFKVFSYYYSGIQLFAQPGINAMVADNQSFEFLSRPIFKIGFRF